MISCNSATKSKLNESKTPNTTTKGQIAKTDIESKAVIPSTTDTQIQLDSKALEFLSSLKSGGKLNSYFNDSWIFVYHEDNRCDGSTDGQLDNLTKMMIDSIITLQVKNNGDGWACDKKEPKTYDLDFDIKKKVADWDRFEISNNENQEKNVVYIVGRGESDYLKLHYGNNDLIIKLVYRSEDPG